MRCTSSRNAFSLRKRRSIQISSSGTNGVGTSPRQPPVVDQDSTTSMSGKTLRMANPSTKRIFFFANAISHLRSEEGEKERTVHLCVTAIFGQSVNEIGIL